MAFDQYATEFDSTDDQRKYSNASEYFNQSVLGYFVSDAVSRRALFEITKLVTIRSSRMKERFYERLVEIPD